MANIDRPNGFRPVGTLSGANWNGSFRKFYADENLFMGDIVEKAATGIGNNDGAYPSVDRLDSATADIAVGVVVGWEVNPDNLGNLYHASSGTYAVYVCVDPMVIFEGQGDGAGTILAALDVGLNTDVVIGAGSTTTGASNMEVDEDTTATVATAATPLHIVGIVDRPDNEIGVANQKILVRLNMHNLAVDAGTAGI
jgi:hypothetical protein